MSERLGNEKFTILLDIDLDTLGLNFENQGHVDVAVDLSDPAFEEQVLSAAGRFRALKRKTRAGAHARPVICGECGERLPRTEDLGPHRLVCEGQSGEKLFTHTGWKDERR